MGEEGGGRVGKEGGTLRDVEDAGAVGRDAVGFGGPVGSDEQRGEAGRVSEMKRVREGGAGELNVRALSLPWDDRASSSRS